MINRHTKIKGFTLLISIVVTSMLLLVSFVVANIAYKQLVLANSNQESQYAFYNADTGIECAVYWDFRNGASAFTQPLSGAPVCNGQPLNVSVVSAATTTFTLNFSAPGKGCVTVNVGKYGDGTTIIDSKGYNTCTPGATRKLERGEKLSYVNSGGGGGPIVTGTIGNNSIVGASPNNGSRNYVIATRFTMPNENGTLTSISVFIEPAVSASPNDLIQVAIYSDLAGSPRNLIANSANFTIVPNSWNTVPINASLTANTVYHLAYNTNASSAGQNNIYYSSGGAAGQFSWTSQAFGAWPAVIGSTGGSVANIGSIYGTYTVP
jgi:hypothetical protein